MNTATYIRNYIKSISANVANTSKTQKDLFLAMRAHMFQNGIHISYDLNADGTVERMQANVPRGKLFEHNTVKSTKLAAIYAECNGLILDCSNYTPLVIPIPNFYMNVPRAVPNIMLSKNEYDIYRVNDGTVINLYYWIPPMKTIKLVESVATPTNEAVANCVSSIIDNVEKDMKKMPEMSPLVLPQSAVDCMMGWRISSTKGIDVTDTIWKSKTYRQILCDVFKRNGIDEMAFYDSLDPAYCYSFIFKHPEFQPFREGKSEEIYRLVYVQCVKLETGEYILDQVWRDHTKAPSIPFQERLRIEPAPTDANVEVVTQMSQLDALKESALNDFIENGIVNYGYILRAKPEIMCVGNINHHIFLESTLLRTLRYMLYSKIHNDVITTYKYEREKYIIVRSYLNLDIYGTFSKLFPQYKTHFDKLDQIRANLVTSVIQKSKPPRRQKAGGVASGNAANASKKGYAAKSHSILDKYIDMICRDMNMKLSISYGKDAEYIVDSNIRNINFCHMFYELLQ